MHARAGGEPAEDARALGTPHWTRARLVGEGGVVFLDDTPLPGVRHAVEAGAGEAPASSTVAGTGSSDALARPFERFASPTGA